MHPPHDTRDPGAPRPPLSRDPRGVLAVVARAWTDQGAADLPAPVADWLVRTIDHGLQGAPVPDGTGGPWQAFPAGWPRDPDASLGALDRLQRQILAGLLDAGVLDAVALATVLETFSQARAEATRRHLAGRPGAGQAPALQQALAARDRHLSIATHELRTPIASILLNLQMLERAARNAGSLDAAAVERLLAVPSRQLRRLTRMVDLLLDAAQVENERLVLHRRELDLCQLVHDAAGRLQELAQASRCRMDLQACRPVTGHWDRERLEQVVTNLVTNAIKYGGGHVTVATDSDGREATLTVRDNGPGIAEEDRARIFEPFERLAATASEDGAGLGLYIVREIVRAHGGRISVASDAGAGSTFRVHLPVRQQET